MKITIHGSGYVGLVTGACLSEVGNHVVCVDIDRRKVDSLRKGQVPIYEPGLEEIVRRNFAAGRLEFTTDVAAGVAHAACQVIAVGTPPDEDGSADLRHVLAVARNIGTTMSGYRLIVTKSTVPVGTADKVRAAVSEVLATRKVADAAFDVVSNPEFLKEGAAVADFMKPDRIVIGSQSDRATAMLREIYEPFSRNHDKIIVMDVRSAELTKYAANAMLATKISFMNELANLAERCGADIEHVRIGIGSDPRIGYSFIYPGCGYGGSCFPKDVSALVRSAREVDFDMELVRAVEGVNERQKHVLFSRIREHLGDVRGRTIALWGLAFKPNTDDMREASSRVLMEQAWAAGARIRAYDPKAAEEAHRVYGDRPDLVLCRSSTEALEGADVLAIVTEWQEFRSPDFDAIRGKLRVPAIFDGRNIYDPAIVRRAGLAYYGIGRTRERPGAGE